MFVTASKGKASLTKIFICMKFTIKISYQERNWFIWMLYYKKLSLRLGNVLKKVKNWGGTERQVKMDSWRLHSEINLNYVITIIYLFIKGESFYVCFFFLSAYFWRKKSCDNIKKILIFKFLSNFIHIN